MGNDYKATITTPINIVVKTSVRKRRLLLPPMAREVFSKNPRLFWGKLQ